MNVIHIVVGFSSDCNMGRPKIGIIFEHSITYLLKKKKSYRNIQRELKGHEHEIWILTIHRVKHSKRKTLCTRSKKPKIGPFRKTPQKSTNAVMR